MYNQALWISSFCSHWLNHQWFENFSTLVTRFQVGTRAGFDLGNEYHNRQKTRTRNTGIARKLNLQSKGVKPSSKRKQPTVPKFGYIPMYALRLRLWKPWITNYGKCLTPYLQNGYGTSSLKFRKINQMNWQTNHVQCMVTTDVCFLLFLGNRNCWFVRLKFVTYE